VQLPFLNVSVALQGLFLLGRGIVVIIHMDILLQDAEPVGEPCKLQDGTPGTITPNGQLMAAATHYEISALQKNDQG
jgi:hypothetical protein